jgi:hypothetical protein
MFQQWKNMMIYERTKAAKLKEYIEQWKVTQSECTTPSVDSRSSISESPRKQNDTPHHIPKKPTLDSIGEPIGLHHKQKKSDSDVFFFIHAIKNDKEYLSSNTYTPIKKK